jgi:hypothetical protein
VLLKSLSARLLVLTVFFVMVGEVLIFVPSVARFRMTYFENRIAAGELAALALEASPSGHLDRGLVGKLLARVGAHCVIVHRADGVVLMLDRPVPPIPNVTIDLTRPSIVAAIRGSLMALARTGNRVLRVLGPSPAGGGTVEVLLDEAPLRREMWDFGYRILELSIVLSLITAALVYLSLQWLLVRPMRRVTASMMAFREDPEDAARMITASRRRDEIGVAEARRARHRGDQDQPRFAQHPRDRAARHRWVDRECRTRGAPHPAAADGRDRPRRRAVHPHARLLARGCRTAGAEPVSARPVGRRNRRRPRGFRGGFRD